MEVDGRGSLQDIISEQAANDADYRKALLDDPKAVLQGHLGQELPDWMNVKVVEESADTIFLIAPHVPSEELDDADLEMVAGGKGGSGTTIKGNANCTRNYGAFNSIINIQSTVSV